MASATCVNSSDSLPFSFLPRRLSSADHRRPSSADEGDSLDPIAISDDDFEFRLEDPVSIIPADELFSDGKLQITTTFSSSKNDVVLKDEPKTTSQISNSNNITTCTDSYLFSPKAPRCSSRWKEILGLKKYTQSQTQSQTTKTTSFKHFLHRNSRSSSNSSCSCNNNSSNNSSLDQSLSLPLLKDNNSSSNKEFIEFYDTVSISTSRLSLSSSPTSSSSSYPYGSTEKPDPNPFVLNRNPNMKMLKSKTENGNGNGNGNVRVGRSPVRRAVGENPAAAGVASGGVSVDSPRLNSSGKIVFQSLERSSSSPSSFNGGPRYKHRGMERSYSANVRVTPVLNVPVCSLPKSVFGIGQLFSSSPQKREGGSGKAQGNASRNRFDRT